MEWLNKVASYIPDIAAAVATGGSSIPMTAVRILSKEVFGEETTDAKRLNDKMNQLSSSELSELSVKLQKVNSDYKVAIAKEENERLRIENERYRNELDDTQDAREKHKGHWMTATMSLLAVALFSALAAVVLVYNVPDANRQLVTYMVGQASGFASGAFIFWIGSARGTPQREKH